MREKQISNSRLKNDINDVEYYYHYYYYHEMGQYQYLCKKLRSKLEELKKSCDCKKFAYAMNSITNSENEDCGAAMMVSKSIDFV